MTTTSDVDTSLSAAADAYLKQSEVVASLRASVSCKNEDLIAAENLLRELKRKVDAARKAKESVHGPSNDTSVFNRGGLERLLKQRFFIAPSFEIYGGVAGLYDYGPPGCSVKNNFLALWRQHFVVEEAMLEIEASCLTPEPVLKASGHVDKFSDLMVKDKETGECFRADHQLGKHLTEMLDKGVPQDESDEIMALRERLDELDQTEMDEMLTKYNVKAPVTGNAFTPAYPFNLMFATQIGPSGLMPGYLRPETAQGIFVNFKRLLEYMGGRLPFACAQIGTSFRNEISPKAGLIRVREFQQAEIEHFVNAEDKSHPKFRDVRDIPINMYGRAQQMKPPFKPVGTTVGVAVDEGVIANETLGYFIGRTAAFASKIGLAPEHVRFRQHLEHEMAHYATDCWDLEVNCSYGWVECAGLADRSAFDLGNHSEKTGQELTAREVYAEPRKVEVLVATPNKGQLGRMFKRNAQTIMKALVDMSGEELAGLETAMERDGKASIAGFEVSKEHVSFKKEKRTETGRNFYPSVIEPSFGVGRLLYCLWEHCYYVREGGDAEDGSVVRAVLGLRPSMAPVKCGILPLSKNVAFESMVKEVGLKLGRAGLISRVDDSGQSIGRRYCRADEIGTPFGITVDFKSLEDGTVTVRERDSTKQIRCDAGEAVEVVKDLVDERKKWDEICQLYGVIES